MFAVVLLWPLSVNVLQFHASGEHGHHTRLQSNGSSVRPIHESAVACDLSLSRSYVADC